MRSIIVGTAGHIDHGKTSLVRRLTGIDTDRLAEEKRRGISIELGFAHLQLAPDLRAGFVDVPGHERFVRTMLAGATGIDLVLLVIAADESIKPQTREHFDICRLLGVERGIVVITKADAVDPDWVELVKLEAEEFVAGSFLEGAAILPVSSKTGEGLEVLQAEIIRLAAELRPRQLTRAFRLPIDRAFAMKGFGSVVTGTLTAGQLDIEREVELYPAGRRLRVRGLQVHGESAPRALAGQRTAVNLAGIDSTDIERGMVLSEPGWFVPVRIADCRFELLPSAKPLKLRTQVHVHAGAAETMAEMRLLDTGFVRLRLRHPLLLLPGDRFIVRLSSPVITIGGGRVLEIDPPRRASVERLRALESSDPATILVASAPHGLDRHELRRRLGYDPVLPPTLLVLAGQAVTRAWAAERTALATKTLATFHRAHPLQNGMAKEELRLKTPAPVFDALLAQSPQFVVQSDLVRLATHRVQLQQDEAGARTKIEEAFRNAGLATPALSEVLSKCGVEPVRAKLLLQMLLKEKTLVKVSEELVYHATTLSTLKQTLAARKGQRFGVSEFKEWTGVSRKYAIPLLELLDRERVTRREGDQRLIL